MTVIFSQPTLHLGQPRTLLRIIGIPALTSVTSKPKTKSFFPPAVRHNFHRKVCSVNHILERNTDWRPVLHLYRFKAPQELLLRDYHSRQLYDVYARTV